MIVDQHQPIVEKYYGPGKMTPVIERLLQESDRGAKDMIEGWVEERSMQRKVRIWHALPSQYSLVNAATAVGDQRVGLAQTIGTVRCRRGG